MDWKSKKNPQQLGEWSLFLYIILWLKAFSLTRGCFIVLIFMIENFFEMLLVVHCFTIDSIRDICYKLEGLLVISHFILGHSDV